VGRPRHIATLSILAAVFYATHLMPPDGVGAISISPGFFISSADSADPDSVCAST
jgi:hypothetical protein